MALYDDFADFAYERDVYANVIDKFDSDLLNKGKWQTKNGKWINIFNEKECSDKHFLNICEMLLRNGYDRLFVIVLKEKRVKHQRWRCCDAQNLH